MDWNSKAGFELSHAVQFQSPLSLPCMYPAGQTNVGWDVGNGVIVGDSVGMLLVGECVGAGFGADEGCGVVGFGVVGAALGIALLLT